MELVMMDVLEEHLDEAAFLWSQWERALVSAHHDLEDTAECEEGCWLTWMDWWWMTQEALREDVLWALGFSGHALAAKACLRWMGDDKAAALAGEAFSAITGLKLEEEYRKAPKEAGDALVPLEQENLDAILVPGPEASLPVPALDPVDRWWQKARRDFERGTRYLRGNRFDAGTLLEAIEREPMRRRPVLALELAIRSRGAHLLQTRAFTRGQRSELSAALAGRAQISMNPLAKLFGI
ncbi:MAG TPA: hypothetical protein VNA24_15775 [Hyalangium sp.]|nr:hypothetical protein [Hyalangium sp.]